MSIAGSTPKSTPPHLIAGLIALTVVTICVCFAPHSLKRLDNASLAPLLARPSSSKDLGMLLQNLALGDPNILPVYGSSELTRIEPNRADEFFLNAPTGFRVGPVGGPGNTCLMMAEKFAALGKQLEGRKLAIFLSCSWFRRPSVPEAHYDGNFSAAQATQIALSNDIDPDLRRRIVRRMLDYPDSMNELGPLSSYCHSLITPHPVSRWSGRTQFPLLAFRNLAMQVEDNLATLFAFWSASPQKVPMSVGLATPFSWEKVIGQLPEQAPSQHSPVNGHDKIPKKAEERFVQSFEGSAEWEDFTLMLDTLKAFHAVPLIVAIPLDGTFEDSVGVGLKARNYYYNRVGELCSKRGFRFDHLADHDSDSGFLISHSSHPTGRGWIFLNRLLDDFYHDRLPPPPLHITRS